MPLSSIYTIRINKASFYQLQLIPNSSHIQEEGRILQKKLKTLSQIATTHIQIISSERRKINKAKSEEWIDIFLAGAGKILLRAANRIFEYIQSQYSKILEASRYRDASLDSLLIRLKWEVDRCSQDIGDLQSRSQRNENVSLNSNHHILQQVNKTKPIAKRRPFGKMKIQVPIIKQNSKEKTQIQGRKISHFQNQEEEVVMVQVKTKPIVKRSTFGKMKILVPIIKQNSKEKTQIQEEVVREQVKEANNSIEQQH